MQAVALLAVVGAAKVKVTVFGEAGCPDTQGFDVGPLNKTYETEGLADIIDLEFLSFGNAYFATQPQCDNSEWNRTGGLHCWTTACGGCGDKCPPGCFSGPVLCQHNESEAQGNILESCAAAHSTPKAFVQFLTCMSRNIGDHCTNCVADAPTCATQAGLNWTAVGGCYKDPVQSRAVLAKAAQATADYGLSRPGTPYTVVNGKPVGEAVQNLTSIICNAYTGPKPVGCGGSAGKVKVQAFVESGCPDCQNFEIGPLNETYRAEGLADIIDLQIVPFGNAFFATQSGCDNDKYSGAGVQCWIEKCGGCGDSCPETCFDGKIMCQHGETECSGNIIYGCAAYLTPAEQLVPWLSCMSKNVGDHCASCVADAPICGKAAGMDWAKVKTCIDNAELGHFTIIGDNAKQTADYGTSRQGVPWVVINDQTVLSDVSTLKAAVCKAYTGHKPAGCH